MKNWLFKIRRVSPRSYVLIPPPYMNSSGSQGPLTLLIPTEVLAAAWRQSLPVERMMVLGGRRVRRGVKVTSLSDVTESKTSMVHVWADPAKLATTLMDLDRSGAFFAVWMHSHPGSGPLATYPSGTDLQQEEELRRHYSKCLVCIIATGDGCIRAWGKAIDDGAVRIRWQGAGIAPIPGEKNVYQFQLD